MGWTTNPDFNSYVNILRAFVFMTDGRMDRQTDGWTETFSPVWASLTTFLQVNNLPGGTNRLPSPHWINFSVCASVCR
jgi:hypothetical protein